ncbi:hypothetical protein LOTGIDRAFT_197758 [Lottia gigantea]|uniref:Autophagy-related protein 2 n=1 Tax=Lottia gigantea TaxID=225164 RepID=V3ZKL3_LOTGI|nr:hypothetical protein LOTGIDRAFT_197758 [Lottia gigantea]ESO82945.1 hypothetical protein LOTGIDRAFT_197758 [Lottia gigantea]
MPWFIPIPESWKKRACRYLLQRYVGHFLKEKLSLDQLSVDLFSGRGVIKDLNLDVEALNESLDKVNAPIEIIDGYISTISMAIPWSCLLSESMEIEIKGLEITIQLKQYTFLNTASMFSSMTSSLQLAEEVINSDKSASDATPESEPFEGVQMFAQTIESVLSRVKLSLLDTIIRLEHVNNDTEKGIALELRIERIDYFDDLANEQGSPVDDCEANNLKLPAEAFKNLHLMGVSLYCDEFSRTVQKTPTMEDSLDINISSSTESMHQHVTFQPQSTASSETLVTNNQPIKIAVFTGKQVLKVKVKQNDSLSGPKMDVDCQIGAIHILLSPWQVHGLLYMLNNIDTQGSSKRNSKKKSARDKLMSSTDYQVVEHELQKQLQTTRLNQPLPEPDLHYFTQSENLLDDSNDESEEIYFSTYGSRKSDLSEMETSTSSIKTDTTMRTNSTATTLLAKLNFVISSSMIFSNVSDNLQKYADDPAAEISHYRMKITFVSVCILHENQSASTQDVFTPALSATEKLRQISDKFFQAVSRITFAGVNVSLKELRDQFSKILPHDHLGFLGKPFTVDCTQKVAPRHKTLSVDFVIGMAELVECLFDRKCWTVCTHSVIISPCQREREFFPFCYESFATKKKNIGPKFNHSSNDLKSQKTESSIPVNPLQCEVDITIIDRLSTLLNNDTYSSSDSKSTSNLYNDYNRPYNSMLFNEAIMDEVPTDKLDITLTSQSATLCIRFPKPDLRSSTERLPWWQRNLHKEILILQLRNFKVLTQVNSGSNESSKLEFTCSDISAFFQEDCTPILIACITSDDTCDNSEKDEGFNWPRLVITSHQISSALQQDEHGDSSDSTPHDSLNGACQFAKSDPSPFSAKKCSETYFQLVLPGNEEELKQFREKESSNTKLLVEIVLPNVVGVLHSKQFFELLYNRVNNDLLLWEPMAPSPINTQEKIHHSLNVLSPHNANSDSDDESYNYYSIRENKQKKQTSHSPTLQSKMCLCLNIGHGKVLANKHGEILAVIDDTVLFSVVCHNGDPYLRYLCFQANKIDLCHNGTLTEPSLSGEGALDSLRSEQTRSLHPCIRRSVRGIPSKLAGQVGIGTDSKDMLTVAVKSKLDTINNVKDYTVSVCVKGGTLHHRMCDTGESWITQALDLLDLRDYPILGYIEPKVVTQLHLHLWSCSIDYRPLYLPLRSMLTADTFSISSNIVTGSQTSLLRFQLDDAALFLSDKQYMEVNIKDEYVCVGDLERLELSLKTNDGKNQKYPKTDLRIHTNRINIRTCSDSCSALADLIQYFATDGDLQPNHHILLIKMCIPLFQPKDGEPAVRTLTNEPIVIIENYIAPPIGKTDLLKQPDDFPTPDSRYTLKELTVVWYMYGGKDFGMANRSKGWYYIIVCCGPGRDCDTLMELQLSKVRFQYDVYPQHTVQASRQVLIIHEVEIRDRLSSSSINKFLYQYTSESLPRQTHANMVLIKAIHTRPDPNLHSQECALKVSLLPLRLNIDQDSLFFLRTFFMELSGEKPSNPYEVSTNSDQKPVNVPKGVSPPTPAPQDEALQAKLSEESSDAGETESQPVFIKTFIFSPDVHIKLDYHGKRLDMQQGTLAGLLAGLAQLNSSELKLRRLNYKHGLLGMDKVLAYSAHEWLTDIRRNQLPSILGGVGPMHSFVQIVHGIKDLFWLPVEQYKKDGRIVRGLQRGASSFTTSTAMALLELTNKLVLSIQYVAELTYDMLSPGPSVRQPKLKHKRFMTHRIRKGQPSDLREGVNNAYIVIKEGFGDAANNLVRAATEEQEQKGLTGVVGGVLRQIPPTIVKPVIIASEATSKVLGGMRNQLRPESKKEDEEKWKGDEK